jgi:hypothetical protein
MIARLATAIVSVMLFAEVRSETVDVEYRGPVDLKTFECRDTPRSSFIPCVCHDKPQGYMIINLKGTYYHYCELPPATSDSLMGASSMGQFFKQSRVRARMGPMTAGLIAFQSIEAKCLTV